MTLIKSISGIRGTIGGQSRDNLTPIDIVKFASVFGQWIFSRTDGCWKVVNAAGGIIITASHSQKQWMVKEKSTNTWAVCHHNANQQHIKSYSNE